MKTVMVLACNKIIFFHQLKSAGLYCITFFKFFHLYLIFHTDMLCLNHPGSFSIEILGARLS